MMNVLEVARIVRDRLGLDTEALGASACSRAIESRMRVLGTANPKLYLESLLREPSELKELAAELVVPETWFFRGGMALYQRLAEFVSARATARTSGKPVRILSIPCSTGEEPYSLAIAIQESGQAPDTYWIDAVDLSQAHLNRARAGSYSSFAFRDPGSALPEEYFQQSGNAWLLSPRIKNRIHFRLGNLTDLQLGSTETPYDLILCRNLFIYLTGQGRDRAVTSLDRLLAPDGCLCVTPAEADRLALSGFVPEGSIEFGLYRRAASTVKTAAVAAIAPTKRPREPSTSQVSIQPIPPEPATPVAKATLPHRAATLEQARAWANEGRLAEARTACEELILARIELPDAYTLLGVIHQADGRSAEAGDAFRKALYLAPNFPDALTHMIVFCQSRGDTDRAEALLKRLHRLSSEDAL